MLWSNPEAVAWLEYEADKTFRAFRLLRNFYDRDMITAPEDYFPRWMMNRLEREMRVVIQPMIALKNDGASPEQFDWSTAWSPRHYDCPDGWVPEVL